MRKLKLSIVFLALLAFFSCERAGFSVTSATLHTRTLDGKSSMEFSTSLSGGENSYAFSITSPSSMLRWEGELVKNEDGTFSSPRLEITKGATFPTGEYAYTLYSSEGTEESGVVRYDGSGTPSYPTLDDEENIHSPDSSSLFVEKDDGSVVEVDSGYHISDGDRFAYYIDQYFNSYWINLN